MTSVIHLLAAMLSLHDIHGQSLAAQPLVIEVQAATPLQIPQEPQAPVPETPPAIPAPVPEPVPPPETAPAPDLPPAAEQPAEGETQPNAVEPPAGGEDDVPGDELSLGEIPVIETIELSPDIAKRALDSYLGAKQKYSESGLEQYENLQDFVDQTVEGKSFEADVKAAGFANVQDWNLAITTLGVAYASVVDDQSEDLRLQIQEIESDNELAQDIKDRMVAALKSMIASDNNRKVVQDLQADPAYATKLAQLDIEEE